MTLNKDLIKKFAHITSSAAVATYKYIGKKDKNLADKAAVDMMRKEMLEASDDLKFEKAAKLRDEIKKLEKELEGIF